MDFDCSLSSYQVLIMTSLMLTVLCCISAAGQILTSSALNCGVEMKGLSRYVRKSKKFNVKRGIGSFYEMIKMVVIGRKIYARMFRTSYTICFSSDEEGCQLFHSKEISYITLSYFGLFEN